MHGSVPQGSSAQKQRTDHCGGGGGDPAGLRTFRTERPLSITEAPTSMSYEVEPDKIVWTQAYQNQQHRRTLGWSLVSFGLEQIRPAQILRNLQLIQTAVKNNAGEQPFDESIDKRITDLAYEQLIDDIRICIFFENCMKAILLFNGVIIHRFQASTANKSQVKQLSDAQKKQPLSVECIALNNIGDDWFHRNTIGMDLLLSTGYQVNIKLPPELLTVVKKINARRNGLHFHSMLQIEVSDEVVREYEAIKAYVNRWVWEVQNAHALAPNGERPHSRE